ncbi:hypothetical protein AVEN_256700-1 [Araneus ventricosus]|uniref:Uncharacterized protein n=1 Tax=Araneus ventricosus TaxID=182803 RepID=A0A4Y2EI11_ARAVE|nr:hypothetical protein AVEN_256700-1 [Araneus ventricosus]
MGGSFMEIPKRTTSRFYPPYTSYTPLPPCRGFLHFGENTLPLAALISAVKLTRTFPLPDMFHLSPASKNRVSFLWPNGMNGNKTTLQFSLCLLQLSSGFHIDEWVLHSVFQKKWIAILVNFRFWF